MDGRVIARAPTDGQVALDNSVEISPRRRLGFDRTHQELVVFPLHRINDKLCAKFYHGFVIDERADIKGRPDIETAARQANFPLPRR